MPNPLSKIQRHLQKIQTLVPAGENTKNYLARTLDAHIAAISPNTPMGIVPPSMLSQRQVYASARMAVEWIESPDKLAEKPEGVVDMGVIEWLLRPALLLRAGHFEPVASGPWQDLPPDIVAQPSQAVCRLDIDVEGFDPIHVGTGFVVGADSNGRTVVMTNTHVVEAAVKWGWTSLPAVRFGCDFHRDATDSDGEFIPLVDEYRIHPHYDLALVYVAPEASTAFESLTLSATPPEPTVGPRSAWLDTHGSIQPSTRSPSISASATSSASSDFRRERSVR